MNLMSSIHAVLIEIRPMLIKISIVDFTEFSTLSACLLGRLLDLFLLNTDLAMTMILPSPLVEMPARLIDPTRVRPGSSSDSGN